MSPCAETGGRDAPVPLAETTRTLVGGGERVESRHRGHVVVTGPDGRGAHLGDPDVVVFPRSAVKPFQATASLELAGTELPDRLVAVGWASHRAEPVHLDAVRELCALAGISPDELTTPPATTDTDPAAPPSPVHHNCSGKHALFALAGRAVGCPRDRLLDPDGGVQRHVLATLEAALGGSAGLSVDGCGAPAVAVRLADLATAFRGLAEPDGRWARVVRAGLAEPLLVGGTGRLESALLGCGVVAKPGAEGVFAAAWRDGDGAAWSLAVAVEDGAARAASAATHGLLAGAGVVPRDVWSPEPVLGGGRAVGSVRAASPVVELAGRLRA